MNNEEFKINRHSIYNLKYHTVSSRLIRKKHSEYLKKYYWKPVFWSRSYCILTTGGATIEIIEKYIRSQAGVKD